MANAAQSTPPPAAAPTAAPTPAWAPPSPWAASRGSSLNTVRLGTKTVRVEVSKPGNTLRYLRANGVKRTVLAGLARAKSGRRI